MDGGFDARESSRFGGLGVDYVVDSFGHIACARVLILGPLPYETVSRGPVPKVLQAGQAHVRSPDTGELGKR